MVKIRFLRSFFREESGLSLTEALLTFPIVMLIFAAFVEFGYAMFQWNQTAKALQLGARVAAVSDWMLPEDDVEALFPTDDVDVALVGTSMPADSLSRTCSFGSSAECDAGLTRLVGVSGRWPGLSSFNPRIGVNNLIVTYERSGLGYYGRPSGGVVTLRLEASGITFDLPIIGALLGLDEIEIPLMPVTITSEDLDTTSGA